MAGASSDGPSPADRAPFVLRDPNFLRLWSASMLSMTGTAVGNTTLLWLVFDRTQSPIAISLLGIAGFLPAILFGVFAGALADRYDRRRVMLLANLARAGCMAAIPVSWFLIGFSLPIALAVVFVLEGFSALFRPASNALLPQLVGPAELDQANALLQVGSAAGISVGSALAGFLIALVGATVGLAINSVAFVVSGLLIALMVSSVHRPLTPIPRSGAPRSMRADVREGIAFLAAQRPLLYGTLAGTAINFFVTLPTQFLVVYTTVWLGAGPLLFGLLVAALTTGFALGAVSAARLHLGGSLGRLIGVGCLAGGGAIAGLGAVRSPLVAAALLVGVGVVLGLLNTTFFASIQRMVPNELLGRYLSLDEVGSLSSVPVAQVVGGLLVLGVGVSRTYWVAGVGLVAVGAAVLLVRDLRELTDARIEWPSPIAT